MPVAIAVFVKFSVTFASEQLNVTLAPGAIDASAERPDVELDALQLGASASATVTLFSVS